MLNFQITVLKNKICYSLSEWSINYDISWQSTNMFL